MHKFVGVLDNPQFLSSPSVLGKVSPLGKNLFTCCLHGITYLKPSQSLKGLRLSKRLQNFERSVLRTWLNVYHLSTICQPIQYKVPLSSCFTTLTECRVQEKPTPPRICLKLQHLKGCYFQRVLLTIIKYMYYPCIQKATTVLVVSCVLFWNVMLDVQ